MRQILALVVMLVGCAESEPVRGPDGTMNWYAVSCRRSQSYCWEEAGRVCPGGYDVADQSQSQGFIATQSYAGTTHHGSMLIRCRVAAVAVVPEGGIEVVPKSAGSDQ